jgi:hypothetical protein
LKSVYVVGADNKVESRQIVANFRQDNDWVVASGLQAGERVVVEGIGKVRSGASVKPVIVAALGSLLARHRPPRPGNDASPDVIARPIRRASSMA